MKHLVAQARKAGNKLAMVFSMLLISLYSFAQDKKVDIDIDTKPDNDNFFMQPWVWIVGGAVFLLLLVALLRGNNSNK
jgi:cell division protein FtsW (lipid II flippase)